MGKIISDDISFVPISGYGCIYYYVFENKYYVGQTRTAIKVRHKHHITRKNIPFDNFIAKYNLLPTIIAIAPISELNRLEQEYIIKFNSMYPSGWNFTTGGDTPKVSPAVFSEKVRENMSLAHRGKKPTNAKKVYQYDKSGKYIAEYESFADAGRAVSTRPNFGLNIAACIRNGKYSSGGYMWSLVKVDRMPPYSPPKYDRKGMRGHTHTEETKAKMSKLRKEYLSAHPENYVFQPRITSEETKRKISESEKRTKSKHKL